MATDARPPLGTPLGEREAAMLPCTVRALGMHSTCFLGRLTSQNSNPMRLGLPKILPSQCKMMDQYVDEMDGDRPIYR